MARPIAKLQGDCFDLIASVTDDFHCIDASCGVSLDFVLWLFALEPEVDQWSLLLQALGVHLEISSQVWSRLEVIFAAWPFLLVALVDPRRSAEDKRNITDSFFKAFECDLDIDVGIPLRAFLEKIGSKGPPYTISSGNVACHTMFLLTASHSA